MGRPGLRVAHKPSRSAAQGQIRTKWRWPGQIGLGLGTRLPGNSDYRAPAAARPRPGRAHGPFGHDTVTDGISGLTRFSESMIGLAGLLVNVVTVS